VQQLKRPNSTPEEYTLYLQTLARFDDSRLLERTLAHAISPDVRSQDSLLQIGRVMQNPAGRKVAWDFVQAHWPEIDKIGAGFTDGAVVAAVALSAPVSRLTDKLRDYLRRELPDFAQLSVNPPEET